LIELSEREGIAMWFYLADMITLLEKRIGDASFVLRRDGVTLRHVRDPVAELCTPPHKVLVETASPSQDAATIAQVQACVGDRARVLASSPMRIDVLVPGVCKSWAMSWVAEHLGVQQEETIGIGDADNDVEMVEWAGLGIAMGNGTPAVRAAADWIAPPLEADGVAAALRRFALSR